MSDALVPGSTFGGTDGSRFLVEAEVGRGGQAVVLRVKDQRLSRLAAVKVSTASGPNRASYLDRFEHELRMTSRVRHPHVVQVYDCGELPDGSPYVLLEWMKLGALSHFIIKSRDQGLYLPLKHVRYYATSIAVALRAAHKASLIHRDVKPENVLIGHDGVAKLTDFGIAKDLTESAPQLTAVGHTLGTFGFMAPEQIQGMPGPQSDIFSWGASVYAILMGSLLPQEKVNGFPVGELADGALDGVPECFKPILGRATEPDLRDRYPSMREVLADLAAMELPRDVTRETLPPLQLPSLPSAAFMSGITDESPVQEPVVAFEARTRAGGFVPEAVGGALDEVHTGTGEVLGSATKTAVGRRALAGSVSEVPAPEPRAKRSLLPFVAAAAVVLGLGAWAALSRGGPISPAEEITRATRYVASLAAGSVALVDLPASATQRDAGRLVAAADALSKGEWERAQAHAQLIQSEDPTLAAESLLIRAASARLASPEGYSGAAELYRQAAQCTECGDVAGRGQRAFAAACAVAPQTAGCPEPASSPRDQALAAAAVLRGDAHADAANARLVAALALPGPPSCYEATVLSTWNAIPATLSAEEFGHARAAAAALSPSCGAP